VARSVLCRCAGHHREPCGTAEPIEMSFGGQTCAGPENRVLDASAAGPDLREGKLGSCPGPPRLRGLQKKNSKKLAPKET